ncbi:SDR family oxidoreductase [Fictibacillus sp. Mic-4]|uniref:SDR family NAD(P)-dependent oxidoreductase n=1 Tax=Fictibacillus sp. Mic-4 TaxID=3132826 RepID=UPI003CE92C5D
MNNWQGKVIVITGASGGLGARIALDAAERGATPVLMARRMDQLENIQSEIKNKFQIDAWIYSLDVGNLVQVKNVFEQLFTQVSHVDVLINNAGFGIFEEFIQADINDIVTMFQTNVIGLMACTKAVLPHMMIRDKGHIINIASQAGKIATPKSSGYTATKHAVLGFSNSLRMELSKTNIHVTTVNPGPIETNFFSIADKSGNYVESVKRWLLSPELVSKKVITSIDKPVREINLPFLMNIGSKIYQMMPGFIEKVAASAFNKK